MTLFRLPALFIVTDTTTDNDSVEIVRMQAQDEDYLAFKSRYLVAINRAETGLRSFVAGSRLKTVLLGWMESGCLCKVVRKLLCVEAAELRSLLLKSQSGHFELTKSLLNLLHNIVRTEAVRATKTTRQAIERHEVLVWQLLSTTASLSAKTRLLADNLDLVYALSRSCPPPSVPQP